MARIFCNYFVRVYAKRDFGDISTSNLKTVTREKRSNNFSQKHCLCTSARYVQHELFKK